MMGKVWGLEGMYVCMFEDVGQFVLIIFQNDRTYIE